MSAKFNYELGSNSGFALMSQFAITVKAGENAVLTNESNVKKYTSAWDTIAAGATVTYSVTMELPGVMANAYKKAETSISARMNAVQANANVSGEAKIEKFIEVKTTEVLKAALANGGAMILSENIAIDEIIDVSKNLAVDLGGHTLSITAEDGRPFNVTAENVTVALENGDVVIPEGNEKSYGLMSLRGAGDAAVLTDVTLNGNTDAGAFVKTFADDCDITLNNVSGTTNYYFASIDGAASGKLTVNGGEYNLIVKDSAYAPNDKSSNFGGFMVRAISVELADKVRGEFNNVTINSKSRLACGINAGTVAFNNCTIGNPQENTTGYLATAISIAFRGTVTINGGTYSAKHALYVFSSGGTIIANSGTFRGNIRIDLASNYIKDGATGTIVLGEGVEWNGTADDVIYGGRTEETKDLFTFTDNRA